MKPLSCRLFLLMLTLIHPVAAVQASDTLASLDNLRRGGNYLSSAQPSAEQLQALAAQGVTAVINLRDDAIPEQASWTTAAGMAYYHIPITDGSELSAAKVAQLHQLLSSIAGQQALLHCSSGNRAAAMLALHAAWHQGLNSEALLQRLHELLKQ